MRRVHLLATGGTIASRQGAGGLAADTPAVELLAAADPPDDLTVTSSDLGTAGSFALTTSDLQELVAAARRCLEDGVDGVVVTHGTDTMEESAYLADLVHDDPRPIVFTGAQRPFDSPAPDGPANLADALRVASAPAARDLGALLCFDGLAFAARGVRKADTLRSGAFGAPGRGPVIRLAGDAVLPLSRSVRPSPLALDLGVPLPRVDVVACYLGADAALVQAAVAAGAAGLVLEAFGAGNVPPAMAEAAEGLVATGTPVLVCSRVPSGPVAPLYAAGGVRLARAGAVFAGDLSPWQGRLLLAAALALAPDDPQRVLAQHLAI